MAKEANKGQLDIAGHGTGYGPKGVTLGPGCLAGCCSDLGNLEKVRPLGEAGVWLGPICLPSAHGGTETTEGGNGHRVDQRLGLVRAERWAGT